MKAIATPPNLVEQVRDAVLEEIASGRLAPGARIIQEQIAQALGVSRQPVQQALLLLRNLGVVRDAPGRGLEVAPLDPEVVRHIYELRGAVEALAARRAAQRGADRAARDGAALIAAGRAATAGGSVARMAEADLRFHAFVHELSGNPFVARAMSTHEAQLQRVMVEVLRRSAGTPRDIWDQHEAILEAIAAGDAGRAEALADAHIQQAADYMVERLRSPSGAR
jgi:DNA-binding GntR family transcriptional regulator